MARRGPPGIRGNAVEKRFDIKVFTISLCVIAGIAYIDYVTGFEIRIFPLYFLPLAYSAWYDGKWGAVATAAAATIAWAWSMFLSEPHYTSLHVWVINVATQGCAFMVVAFLLVNLKDSLSRERSLSRTDPLTGLANRRAFYEKAALALALCDRNEWPVTLAYLDLDNFKSANDTHGHQHGDDILQGVAQTFNECLRASDITARMSGDEFAVLLLETGPEQAQVALEKVRSHLEKLPKFQSCGVTASIGAVSFDITPETVDVMIKAADDILYKVKGSSKNSVMVESCPEPPA